MLSKSVTYQPVTVGVDRQFYGPQPDNSQSHKNMDVELLHVYLPAVVCTKLYHFVREAVVC